MPTLSRTRTITRVNTGTRAPGSGALRGEVIGDGALGGNGGDRVLEDQLIGAVDVNDDGKAIEMLDARVEVAAVDEMYADRKPLTPRMIEERVLDVRLNGGFGCARFNHLSHQERLLAVGGRARRAPLVHE